MANPKTAVVTPEEDHMAHLAWNALAHCWIEENKPERLDLTKPEQKP